jgi:hypothetical protein
MQKDTRKKLMRKHWLRNQEERTGNTSSLFLKLPHYLSHPKGKMSLNLSNLKSLMNLD